MNSQTESMKLTDAERVAADVTAARMAQQHVLAAIILALAKQKSLDIADVFGFLRVFADGFVSMAKAETSPMLSMAKAIAAEDLAALEPLLRNMLTIPPGAGRA